MNPESQQESSTYYQQEHEDLGKTVDADGSVHVLGVQFPVVLADVGFIEEFAEVVVGTTKAAVECPGEGCLRVAAVGAGMARAVFPHEFQ